MRLFLVRWGVMVIGAASLVAVPAVARQACPPGTPAFPAPMRNPVSLTSPGQEQWFTIPVAGGHVYELVFETSFGASAEVAAFGGRGGAGGDCSHPLALAYFNQNLSRPFTVPISEDHLNLRMRTAPGLIEPVVARFQLADRGPTADTIPNHPSWARPLTTDGVWVDGAIDYPADIDTYIITTMPGADYRIEVRGLTTPGCLGQYRLDHDGVAVRLFRASGSTELISLPGCPAESNAPIPYQVRALAVRDVLPPDRSDDCEAAAPATEGVEIRGEVGFSPMGASDSDAYRWTLAARHAYRLSWVGDVDAQLRTDSCGIRCVANGALDLPIRFTSDLSGTLRVVVSGNADRAVPYEIRLDDLGPTVADEPDQVADATQIIAGAAPVHGFIDHEFDSDVYRFAVDPGWVYEVTIVGEVSVMLLDPLDPSRVEHLYGNIAVAPGGMLMTTVRLLMPLNEPNVRHLVLQAGDGLAPLPTPYSVSIRRDNFVGDADLPDDPEQAASVGIDEPIDFHFNDGSDEDWVVYNGPPRRKYRVASAGATQESGGILVMSGPESGGYELTPGETTTLETDGAGRLLINGTAWSTRPTTVTTTVTDIGPATDVVPGSPSAAFTIRPNRDTIRGVVDSGSDHDVYVFAGHPGHAYRIVLRSAAGIGSVTTVVRAASEATALRAFGLVEPPATEPVIWLSSPRFVQPAAPASSVLDVSAYGRAIVHMEYGVRIETVCRADWNDDGTVTVSDLLAYLVDFLGDASNAEFDHIGETTIADLMAFLTDYFDACSV